MRAQGTCSLPQLHFLHQPLSSESPVGFHRRYDQQPGLAWDACKAGGSKTLPNAELLLRMRGLTKSLSIASQQIQQRQEKHARRIRTTLAGGWLTPQATVAISPLLASPSGTPGAPHFFRFDVSNRSGAVSASTLPLPSRLQSPHADAPKCCSRCKWLTTTHLLSQGGINRRHKSRYRCSFIAAPLG
jgi:hypothetical protein